MRIGCVGVLLSRSTIGKWGDCYMRIGCVGVLLWMCTTKLQHG